MKAAAFCEPGGPENIQITEVPDPLVAPDQVLVKVKACALNHFDLLVLRESDPETISFPFWGGADISGIVEMAGKSVSQFKNGDRVVINPGLYCGKCEHCLSGEECLCERYGIIGDTVPGGFAEFIAVNEENVLRLPDGISYEEAAAVPVVYQTAWRALMTRGALQPGEDVLILGASGGVGSAAIQIAKLAGARVFAVTSTAEKESFAEELGADHVLNRNSGNIWKELANLTNQRGVDVVLENVGAATWNRSLHSLVRGGRLVTVGRTTGALAETDIKLIFWNQLQVIGSTMANQKEFSKVMSHFFQGELKPVIDSVFPFEQAREAYQRLEAGEHFGKIIIKVDDD